jgi:hypothetical protein
VCAVRARAGHLVSLDRAGRGAGRVTRNSVQSRRGCCMQSHWEWASRAGSVTTESECEAGKGAGRVIGIEGRGV